MKKNSFGPLGEVSRLTLGGGGIGQGWGPTSREEAIATIHAAVDAGIDLLDTALLYRNCESIVAETFAGRLPTGLRITTKCGLGSPEPEKVERALTQSLDASLAAMKIYHVDIFFLHSNICGDDYVYANRPDLQNSYAITKVVLNWEAACGKSYMVDVSADNVTWTNLYTTTTGAGGIVTINASSTARYVRMKGTLRATGWGYSLWEFEVYGVATKSASLGINSASDIDNVDKSIRIELYPNPALSELYLKTYGVQFESAQVFDLSGKQILQKHLLGSTEVLNVAQLKSGIYIVKLVGANNVRCLRFVKK